MGQVKGGDPWADPAVPFVRFQGADARWRLWPRASCWPPARRPPEKELACIYCLRMYHPTFVTFEWSWFGRTPDDIRVAGRTALWALLRAVDDPSDQGKR